ncbi:hypothetical protein JOM56_004211 [Amanita muscaria]
MPSSPGLLYIPALILQAEESRQLSKSRAFSKEWNTNISHSDVSKQEPVDWLQQQIAEQKCIDPLSNILTKSTKEAPTTSSDLQPSLPVDAKKQRKHMKQLFMDRVYTVLLRPGVRSRVTRLDGPDTFGKK